MVEDIIVKINGWEYPTYIDEHGVQRFRRNEVIDHLFDIRMIDLNQVRMEYSKGKFSAKDYLEFNMMLGYSVSGLCDFHIFFGRPEDEEFAGQGWEIENPLWD